MYKDLDVWKDSVTLIQNVYNVADKLPKSEEYNLKSQIKRAVVSIALNIAEGKTRKSAKNISVASLAETEACLSICEALGYIEHDSALHESCRVLSYRINALKSKIDKK